MGQSFHCEHGSCDSCTQMSHMQSKKDMSCHFMSIQVTLVRVSKLFDRGSAFQSAALWSSCAQAENFFTCVGVAFGKMSRLK